MIKIGNGSFDEARRIYREVLELDPSNIAVSSILFAVRLKFSLTRSTSLLNNLARPLLNCNQ